MLHYQTRSFRAFAAQLLLGSTALTLLTLAFVPLQIDLALSAFAFLVVIVLVSLMGSFTASALLSIAAVLALNFSFTPLLFQFRIDAAQDLAVLAGFLLTSMTVAQLIRNARTEQESAREAEAKLKHAEIELRDSEREWREVFEHNPVMYFMVDANGTVLNVNTIGATQLGYSPAELVGQSVMSVFPEEDRPFVRERVALCLETVGQSHTWEVRKIRKNGSLLWVRENAKAMPRADGKLVVMVACEDITERKQAENALRESEQRFRDYAETASDWLWETGPDHRFTRWSEHTKDTSIGVSGVVGQFPWDLASDLESEPEKWRQHRAMLDAHLPFRDLEYRRVNPMGAPIYIRTSGKPFFDANGTFLGYRGVSTDVTAIVRADQAEQALREAQAELAHVTRVTALGELTTNIAHEINQPLAAILANAEACRSWLDRAPPDLAAARRSVEWIVDDGNRTSEVIRRVRALSKKAVESASLDINVVLREALPLVSRELASQNVAVRMELAPDLPPISGDRVQLQQVIINLVLNAIEAMQCVTDRPRELLIRSAQDERGVVVTVTDCGVGFAEDDVERMFSPFFTTKPGGMGLGLSICRSILESHGGRLSVVRKEGPGATFQFTLPLSTP